MSQVPRLQVVTWSHVHIYPITYTCRTCNMHQTQFLLSDNSNLSELYHVLHLRRRYKDSWRSFDWFSYFDWGKCKHMAKYISSHTTDHTDESEPAVWLYLVVSRESPLPPVRNIRVSSVALFYPLVCLYVGTVWTKYRYIAAHTRTYNWLEQLIRCLGGSYFTYLHPPNILHYLYPLPIFIIRSLSS